MKNSYLVQRLKKPTNSKTDNIFSFGGGLVNGGLSKEAMGLIKDIFRFDYMGSAEFEFGAVPDALHKIATQKNISFSFSVKTKDKNTATIYAISSEENKNDVIKIIKNWASDEYGKNALMTKERVLLQRSIDEPDKWSTDGWLELDNGYFFFRDREMFKKTCMLFEVPFES